MVITETNASVKRIDITLGLLNKEWAEHTVNEMQLQSQVPA